MVLLVSGATLNVERCDTSRIGVLFVPRDKNTPSLATGRAWAADNGAFSGFDADAFVEMLARLRGVPGCKFVAAPDVVGNAEATLRLYRLWEPMIRALGFPVALIAQNGLTPAATPWNAIDALFIGGDTPWKLSREADALLACAAAHGKWRHVGRVNSRRRIRHFWELADSIDGSGFSRWPKHIRGRAERWFRQFEQQPRLYVA